MLNLTKLAAGFLISIICALYVSNASAVPVAASQTSVTDLGFFTAGDYNITATGVISLAGPVGGSPNFDLHPDGVPVTGVTFSSYPYFNPAGSDIADGSYGPGGPGINIGAVMGTLSASPSTYADWFLIGYGTSITLAADQHIYAMVNDTYYPNNHGSFDVVVAEVVPAPAILSLLGFGLLGLGVLRRKS